MSTSASVPAPVRGDTLFHAAHGLCRIAGTVVESVGGSRVTRLSLVPGGRNGAKVRFLIACDELEAAGFHEPVSPSEARCILKYLRGKGSYERRRGSCWSCARSLMAFSENPADLRDARARQSLDSSVRALVRELSCSLKLSASDTVFRIRTNLLESSTAVPQVMASLERVKNDLGTAESLT